jgi:hypothetical protein
VIRSRLRLLKIICLIRSMKSKVEMLRLGKVMVISQPIHSWVRLMTNLKLVGVEVVVEIGKEKNKHQVMVQKIKFSVEV